MVASFCWLFCLELLFWAHFYHSQESLLHFNLSVHKYGKSGGSCQWSLKFVKNVPFLSIFSTCWYCVRYWVKRELLYIKSEVGKNCYTFSETSLEATRIMLKWGFKFYHIISAVRLKSSRQTGVLLSVPPLLCMMEKNRHLMGISDLIHVWPLVNDFGLRNSHFSIIGLSQMSVFCTILHFMVFSLHHISFIFFPTLLLLLNPLAVCYSAVSVMFRKHPFQTEKTDTGGWDVQ